MCSQLLSIIPLIVWIGQWAIGIPAILPAPRLLLSLAKTGHSKLLAPVLGGRVRARTAWEMRASPQKLGIT